jgi:hypothetical protein
MKKFQKMGLTPPGVVRYKGTLVNPVCLQAVCFQSLSGLPYAPDRFAQPGDNLSRRREKRGFQVIHTCGEAVDISLDRSGSGLGALGPALIQIFQPVSRLDGLWISYPEGSV